MAYRELTKDKAVASEETPISGIGAILADQIAFNKIATLDANIQRSINDRRLTHAVQGMSYNFCVRKFKKPKFRN